MKILRIELENLNSLYGRHSVDLTKDLADAPIFLVLGKTGAGKSTLMDAVSLALFGQTPRLTKERNNETTEPWQIMSRGTGFAFASVEFRKTEGELELRYRATWQCERARRKDDGTVKASTRTIEVSKDGGWETIVSSNVATVYAPVFEKVLEGMGVGDFKRCILLAQGEFASFIRASDAERASILERLTDTRIYQQIGQKAAERRKDATDALKLILESVKGVKVLSDEEEAQLRAEYENGAGKIREIEAELVRYRGWMTWLGRKILLERLVLASKNEAEKAKKIYEERAVEFAKLDEYRRCLGALLSYQQVRRSTAVGEAAKEELGKRVEAKELAERALSAARAKLQGAREGYAQRVELYEADREEIGKAREILKEIRAARQEWEGAKEALGKAGERAQALELGYEKLRGAQELLEQQMAEAQRSERENHGAKVLVDEIRQLQVKQGALVDEELRLAKERMRRDGERASLKKLEGIALGAKKVLGEAQVAEEASNRVHGESVLGLEKELAGAKDVLSCREELRREAQAIENGLRLAKDVWLLQRDRERFLGQFREAERVIGEQEGKVKENDRVVEESQKSRSLIEEAILTCQKTVEHLKWQIEMARQRGHLTAGEACPLCGSEAHPALKDGRFGETDLETQGRAIELEKRIAELKLEEGRLGKLIEAGKTSRVQSLARIDEVSRRREELRGEISTRESGIGKILKELGLGEDSTSTEVGEHGGQLREREKVSGNRQRDLETANLGKERAYVAWQEAKQKLALSENSMNLRDQAVQHKRDEIGKIEQGIAEMEAGLRESEGMLIGEMVGFGLVCEKREDMDAAIERGVQMVQKLQASQARLKVVEGKVAESRLAIEKMIGEREASSSDLQLRLIESQGRAQRYEELEPKSKEVLGGRDPELVEREHKALCEAGQKERDLAEAGLRASDSNYARAHIMWENAEKSIADWGREHGVLCEDLGKLMQELGIITQEELVSKEIGEGEASVLGAERQGLTEAMDRARAVEGERRRDFDGHSQTMPEGLGEETPEGLGERISGVEGRSKELSESIGSMRERIEKQRLDREALGAMQERQRQAERDTDLWVRLHGLIGKNNGELFKLYAQSLNLEEMIGKANDHLGRIAPRYQLTGISDKAEEPRIGFAILDEYQAAQKRPLTTLSGGETFLVSLALALALAEYRTVRMPVETLLLDEGFGTLDEGTLNTAMNALSSLQATGIQVGVISHVEALRTRIGARVVVEALGGGRSTLRVELGD